MAATTAASVSFVIVDCASAAGGTSVVLVVMSLMPYRGRERRELAPLLGPHDADAELAAVHGRREPAAVAAEGDARGEDLLGDQRLELPRDRDELGVAAERQRDPV